MKLPYERLPNNAVRARRGPHFTPKVLPYRLDVIDELLKRPRNDGSPNGDGNNGIAHHHHHSKLKGLHN
ncbi:hypothetical protein KIN20_009454 [Parelaphostrongylus tenuis]|uniref:Uncharacterized protein n=1 Tax=Parelaphostrongylus tenuis TaxID=148309 RepID=A0AAD5M882_PARTN|nr:hypothetical protein KIN20_009454 [Parelaphostrongylus tenuis]